MAVLKRRTVRKRVPPIEQVIGGVIVLALAGLAGLFVWDLRAPAPSPFGLDPKLLAAEARPAKLRAANYLLPVPLNRLLKRQGEPRAVSLESLSEVHADLPAAAERYEAKAAFICGYEASGIKLTCAVVETAGPEWAFGLWKARMPAAAATSTLGASGQAWQDDSAGAFWAGKYYIEVRAEPGSTAANAKSEPSAAPAATASALSPSQAVKALMAELGRVQVFYGRPFPAEAILPRQDLQADSLRFQPEPVFGIEPLRPAFIARYEAGFEVAVIQFASRQEAEAAWKALSQEHGPGSDGRVRAELPDGRVAIISPADHYVIAVAARQADQAIALLDEIGRLAEPQRLAAAVPPTVTAEPAGPAGDLPRFQQADLRGPQGIRRFGPDNLYEKIDGRAALYLSYGFVELLFATYAAGETTLDVYVYNMAEPANAFGIYKAEESPSAESIELGRAGYASESGVFFWKGNYYVNVLVSEPADEAQQAAMKLAAAIADRLSDSGEPLWAERLLPQADRVPGSFEYYRRDAFGLDFLRDVYAAEYERNGKRFTLFVMKAASQAAAEQAFQEYRKFAAKYGKILSSPEAGAAGMLVVDSAGAYDLVFVEGNLVAGATAAEDLSIVKDAVTKWRKELASTGAAAGKD